MAAAELKPRVTSFRENDWLCVLRNKIHYLSGNLKTQKLFCSRDVSCAPRWGVLCYSVSYHSARKYLPFYCIIFHTSVTGVLNVYKIIYVTQIKHFQCRKKYSRPFQYKITLFYFKA